MTRPMTAARALPDMHTPSDQWLTFSEWESHQRCYVRFDRDDDTVDSMIVVPYTYCPNVATLLDESNHAVLLARLEETDPTGEDYVVRSYSHWATPYDMILVRPGSAAFTAMAEAIAALADYPVLDEMNFSQREYDAQHECIADALRRLTVFEAPGEETCLDAPPADVTRDERETYLVHVIWAHMWNDGAPWSCLEETGREGGGGPDQDDVERALSELGYVYNDDEMTWMLGG